MDHNSEFNNHVLARHKEGIRGLAGALEIAYQPSPFAAPVVIIEDDEEELSAGK